METGMKTKGIKNQQTVELTKDPKAVIPLATGNVTSISLKTARTTTKTTTAMTESLFCGGTTQKYRWKS